MAFFRKLLCSLLTLALALSDIPFAYAAAVSTSNQYGQNLLRYSEQLDVNTVWTNLTGAAFTANAALSPIGTPTAERLTDTAVTNVHAFGQPSVPTVVGKKYTFSAFFKYESHPLIILAGNGGDGTAYVYVNAQTGTIASTVGANQVSSGIQSLGNGWYRAWNTFIANSNAATPTFYFAQSVGTLSYLGTGTDSMLIWGAQEVLGASPGAYNRTAASARNASYVPSGTAKSTQFAQNILTFSEQFDNAAWVNAGTSVSANTAINPVNGQKTADTITATAGGAFHDFGYSNSGAFVTSTPSGSGPYTFSVYVKRNNNDWIGIMVPSNVNAGNIVYFNTATGAFGTTGANATTLGVTHKLVQTLRNGWYRVSVTIPSMPSFGASTAGFGIFIATADGTNNFSAAGTEAVYLFGAQLEQGTSATGYNAVASFPLNPPGQYFPDSIVTTTVTQAVNVPFNAVIKPGTGSFGVAFWYKPSTAITGSTHAVAQYGTSDYTTGWLLNALSGLLVYANSGGPQLADSSYFDLGVNHWYHIVMTANASDGKIRLYRNGVLHATSGVTSWNVSGTTNTVFGGSNQFNAQVGKYADIILWNGTIPGDNDVLRLYTDRTVANSPVARYRLDEGRGTTLVDSIGTNNASLVNGATWDDTDVPMKSRSLTNNTKSSQLGQNQLKWSEDLSQSGAWQVVQASVSLNGVTAPDGTKGAYTVFEDNTTNEHYIHQNITFGPGPETYSVFAKAAGRSWIHLTTVSNDGTVTRTWFNLSAGTIGTRNHSSATMTAAGNGWYRCSVTLASPGSGANGNKGVFLEGTTGDGLTATVGDVTKGVSVWGAQTVLGLKPGAYNKTMGTALNASYQP